MYTPYKDVTIIDIQDAKHGYLILCAHADSFIRGTECFYSESQFTCFQCDAMDTLLRFYEDNKEHMEDEFLIKASCITYDLQNKRY